MDTAPLRKVVRQERNQDILECGHEVPVSFHEKERVRRRCWQCRRDARDAEEAAIPAMEKLATYWAIYRRMATDALADRCEQASRDLARVAVALKAGGNERVINGLGTLQSQASMIEALSGRVGAFYDLAQYIDPVIDNYNEGSSTNEGGGA